MCHVSTVYRQKCTEIHWRMHEVLTNEYSKQCKQNIVLMIESYRQKCATSNQVVECACTEDHWRMHDQTLFDKWVLIKTVQTKHHERESRGSSKPFLHYLCSSPTFCSSSSTRKPYLLKVIWVSEMDPKQGLFEGFGWRIFPEYMVPRQEWRTLNNVGRPWTCLK